MLVLSRKLNEAVVLPDLGVVIRVVGLSDGRVKLGFDAPNSVRIARSELCPETDEAAPAVKRSSAAGSPERRRPRPQSTSTT